MRSLDKPATAILIVLIAVVPSLIVSSTAVAANKAAKCVQHTAKDAGATSDDVLYHSLRISDADVTVKNGKVTSTVTFNEPIQQFFNQATGNSVDVVTLLRNDRTGKTVGIVAEQDTHLGYGINGTFDVPDQPVHDWTVPENLGRNATTVKRGTTWTTTASRSELGASPGSWLWTVRLGGAYLPGKSSKAAVTVCAGKKPVAL
jgi:hypothetical protein